MAVAAGRRGRALGVRRAVLLAVAVVATLGAACSGGGGDERSRRTEVTAPTTTTLSPEGEVLAALDKYIDVLTRAYYDLDPTGVDRVASGEMLATIVAELARWKAEGTPMRLVEDHRYKILELTADRAVVRDRFVNHSVELDPVTREPIEPPSSEQFTGLLTLERLEGTWKVVVSRAE